MTRSPYTSRTKLVTSLDWIQNPSSLILKTKQNRANSLERGTGPLGLWLPKMKVLCVRVQVRSHLKISPHLVSTSVHITLFVNNLSIELVSRHVHVQTSLLTVPQKESFRIRPLQIISFKWWLFKKHRVNIPYHVHDVTTTAHESSTREYREREVSFVDLMLN